MEVALLSIHNLSMRFGAKVLFEDVTCTFLAGRRYAISGPNGAGKSTLMKILTGEIEPEKGTVTRPKKLGILRQDQFAFDEFRVIDTVIMGNAPLWKALQERDALYAKPHEELTDEDGMRLGELEGIVGEEGGYTAEPDAAALLAGLDVDASLHERKMRELQGGQKVRVLLAQALFGNPHALLLDEPTNHLDLDSVHWLQDYLARYEGVLIVISHDRHFLNSVCTHTADIDYETVILYTGGYDDMVLAKTRIRARIEAENAQREKKIAQLNEFIARFSAGTRSSQVTSRRKEVERLQTSELAKSNIQRPYLRFDMKRPSGRHPLEINGLSKSYGGLRVIRGLTAGTAADLPGHQHFSCHPEGRLAGFLEGPRLRIPLARPACRMHNDLGLRNAAFHQRRTVRDLFAPRFSCRFLFTSPAHRGSRKYPDAAPRFRAQPGAGGSRGPVSFARRRVWAFPDRIRGHSHTSRQLGIFRTPDAPGWLRVQPPRNRIIPPRRQEPLLFRPRFAAAARRRAQLRSRPLCRHLSRHRPRLLRQPGPPRIRFPPRPRRRCLAGQA
jgi:ABC-type cobalamin/Fe3+-siderophores transport system ATPase subunit